MHLPTVKDESDPDIPVAETKIVERGKGNIVITGGTGSGKSYFLVNNILEPLLKTQTNIIMIDVKDQHTLGKDEVKIVAKDQPQLEKALKKFNREKRFRIRIVPERGLEKGKREFVVNEVSKFASRKGNLYVIVEEFNYFLRDKYNIPIFLDDMMRLDTCEHNKNIYVIIVTQFPSDVPKDIWGNVHTKVFFFQNEKLLKNCMNSGHIRYAYTWKEDKKVYPAGYQGQYYVE